MKSAVSSLKGSFFKSPFGTSSQPKPASLIVQPMPSQENKQPPSAYDDAHALMKEKIKMAVDEESEDEKYDYGAECQEVYLNRERPNTFFEEIYFKKDPKYGLVYTNEENMKK